MKSKVAILGVIFGLLAGTAQAQSCSVINPAQGPASLSLPSSIVSALPTQCYIEPSAPGGAAIACIHGYPTTAAYQQLLVKIALRMSLTATEKSQLTGTGGSNIRGGFAVDSLGSVQYSARQAIFATRNAFNSYINANYSPASSVPNLLISDIDSSDNSVSSIDIAGASGTLEGFHASGNLSMLTGTLFHVIMDTRDIDGVHFLRIGPDLSTWTVCQNLRSTPSTSVINAFIHSLVMQYQTAGATSHRVLMR
ncbi:MAG: hypothetical protein K1X79_10230 [Oligoflexia bacterium]|nr:hypothetical protein [Oligoflexia bacterium]